MRYLVNPQGKRKMAKKRRSAAQRAATRKLVARNKRGGTRKRAGSARRANPRAVRRGSRRRQSSVRSYSRNPPILKEALAAAQDAAFGFAGATVVGLITPRLPNFIDPPSKGGTGATGQLVNQLVTSIGVAVVARMMFGASARTRAIAQGAMMVPVSAVVTPQLQKTGLLGAYSRARLASYVQPRQISAGGMGAYVRAPQTLSGYEDGECCGAGGAY